MKLVRADYWPCILLLFLFCTESFRSGLTKDLQGIGLGQHLADESETEIYSNDTCTAAQNDKYKSCACMVERTKSYVNLNGIIRNCTYNPGGCKVPRFTVSGDDKWDYAYHPCFPFTMFRNASHFHAGDKACANAAAARFTTESALICDSLGSQDEFQFKTQATKNSLIVSNLGLVFNNRKLGTSAFISLVCNASVPANESIFTFHGIVNNPVPTYYLAVESICCCPGGCNVTFPIYNKESSKPTKGFWAIVGIVSGIIIIMIVAIIFVKCTTRGTRSEERQRLIDPVS